MSDKKGVYPCYENQFQISTDGGTTYVDIADMETFSVSIDGNVEEWKPYEAKGWTRRLVTGKALTISVSGKRNVGDTGNDYVNGLALKTGSDATVPAKWNFPDGSSLEFNAVVSVTEWGAGDSTAVAPLAFDLMSDGKPEFTEASTASEE